MLREFTHTANEVTIGENVFSLSDFVLLFPDYKLPDGVIGQSYKQNICHRLFYENGEHKDIGTSWPEGDNYILNQYTFRAELKNIKDNNNPKVIPSAEALLDLSISKRKEKLDTSPYNKLTDVDYLKAVKKHRNNLLKNCDWTILPDSPLEQDVKDKWIAYRKKLRDLPTSKSNAFEIAFPKPPQ